MSFLKAVAAIAMVTLAGSYGPARAADPEIKLGFAKCAHCVPMGLTPQLAKGVAIDATAFTSGNDVLTALVSKSVDIAQVTYLHFVTALDKGFDIVAISGEVNGGSELLSAPALGLKADDWDGLKKLVAARKQAGTPLRVAASRGNAQDLHMRGVLATHGINPDKDVQFINIPNPADHAAALQRNEVDLVSTVEPFASQIRMNGAGKHFDFPYDQAAGKLTNLIVTRSDVIRAKPQAVQSTVDAVVALVGKLKTDQGMWVGAIAKYTALDPRIAAAALDNAYPDYAMYQKQTLAIARMMKDLHYVSTDVSAQIPSHMDYSFLARSTGKTPADLGQ
ncbi:ABC transporter substrate-binding protein [Bordetella genomosp. 9]|nr:ABC transporter substrate-binding protein [Bordetella genomosp. 9]